MDPIADMLIRIKNAGRARQESTVVPYSKLKFEIANVLLSEGYIKSFSVKGKKIRKHLEIEIAYSADASPRVSGADRVSKLSRRVYAGFNDIRPVKQGLGLLMLSTPKGIMSGKEARKLKVGGEVLFSIW
ncbi:MAG TPA: 30S ribosomal protein S8 [Candidatus Paceibacterota bacterium]